jgi:hypothetical protein
MEVVLELALELMKELVVDVEDGVGSCCWALEWGKDLVLEYVGWSWRWCWRWGLELVLMSERVCVGVFKLRCPSECVFDGFLSFHLSLDGVSLPHHVKMNPLGEVYVSKKHNMLYSLLMM